MANRGLIRNQYIQDGENVWNAFKPNGYNLQWKDGQLFGQQLSGEQMGNVFGAGGTVASGVGIAINDMANAKYAQNAGRADLADLVSGNSWGDVFDNKNKLAAGMQTVQDATVDYSDVKDNNSMLNAWDANDLQDGIRDSKETGAVIGATLHDAASLASKGSKIGGPVGALIGGTVGTISGLSRGLISAFQHNKNADIINEAVEKANNVQIDSFYTTAQTNQRRDERNAMMNYSAFGGKLFPFGGDMNGVTTFNTGGTHGQNPLMGIPQGVDAQGVPNKVEEGEVKYEDYIYSNRISPSKSLLKKYNLPEKYNGLSFAKVAEKLQKESEDRPNDATSLSTLQVWMERLKEAQEEYKTKAEERRLAKIVNQMSPAEKAQMITGISSLLQDQQMQAEQMQGSPEGYEENMQQMAQQQMAQQDASQYAKGGKLFDERGSTFKLTPPSNPYGKPIGSLWDLGTTSLSIYKPYDPKFKPTPQQLDSGLSYDILYNYNKSIANNPDIQTQKTTATNTDATTAVDSNPTNTPSKFNFNAESLRYAPVVGAALGALEARLQPEDRTLERALMAQASRINPVSAGHIGGYRTYRPYDVNLGDTENLAIQARAIRANQGQNRATQGALNIAVINAMQKANAQRNLAAQQANEAMRENVDKYNLGINQFNAQQDRAYDQLNNQRLMQRLSIEGQAAQARDVSRTAQAQNINNTTTNFWNQLGNVGRDAWNRGSAEDFLEALGYSKLLHK